MISALASAERARHRQLARRQWRETFVRIGYITVQGFGRTLVWMQRLETRWSDTYGRREWRLPSAHIRVTVL